MGLARFGEFHSDKLVSFSLKTLDNFSDKPSLDPVGLDHNVWKKRGNKKSEFTGGSFPTQIKIIDSQVRSMVEKKVMISE
jgi:hypothetical protein